MMDKAENPFWDFSLAVYARDGVAPACLRLQDRFDLDVNVLLYCCWAAHGGAAAFDRETMAQVLARVADWKSDVVLPLRAVRRALKGELESIASTPREALRTQVKRIELEAERMQQDALVGAISIDEGASPPALERRSAANANCDRLMEALGATPDPAARADLTHIVNAAFADIR